MYYFNFFYYYLNTILIIQYTSNIYATTLCSMEYNKFYGLNKPMLEQCQRQEDTVHYSNEQNQSNNNTRSNRIMIKSCNLPLCAPLETLHNTLKNQTDQLVQGIKDQTRRIVDGVKEQTGNIVDGVKEQAGRIVGDAKDAVLAPWRTFKHILRYWYLYLIVTTILFILIAFLYCYCQYNIRSLVNRLIFRKR